jgi:CheY-like chemotaxis protein
LLAESNINNTELNNIKIIEKPRILLVEDDAITNEVIKVYLNNDFVVDIAVTEQQAMSFIRNSKYFAVLLDINLGRGGSGLNVIKEIRKIPGLEKLPVIAETAFAMHGDSEEFVSAGCNYYLPKPYIRSDLLELIDKIKIEQEL